MTVPPLARAVARALADEALDVPPANEERRERAILAIREELLLREKRRTRRRWATIALVAAAVLLGAGGAWSIVWSRISTEVATGPSAHPSDRGSAFGIVAEEVHGDVSLTTSSGSTPLPVHVEVANDQGVVTGEGNVTLALGNAGTRVRIDPHSSAALSNGPDAGVVRVKSGAVTAMVAKLRPHERFLVQTDEAEVEAHGTVFTVARTTSAECGARTFVRVVEGRISIRDKGGTLFMGPGEDWKSACSNEPPAPTQSAPTPPPLQTARPTQLTNAPPIVPSPQAPLIAPSAAVSSTVPATVPTTPGPGTSAPYPEFGRRK